MYKAPPNLIFLCPNQTWIELGWEIQNCLRMITDMGTEKYMLWFYILSYLISH